MSIRPTSIAHSFQTREDGSIAIMFGLFFMALMLIMGIAIDFARTYHTSSRVSAAIDAAALAAGRALLDGRFTDDEIRAMALRYFDENTKGGGDLFGTIGAVTVQINRATGAVTIDAPVSVPTTITAITGVQKIDVPVSASVTFDQQDVEVAVQLDLTGSMCNPCTKINDLKLAAHEFVNILLPDNGTPNKIRIAFAPFASGVNVGGIAGLVTNNRNGTSNCVYDRNATNLDTDAAPGNGTYFKGRLDLPTAQACPSSRIVPLTDSKSTLHTAVNGFTTSTTTAGQVGAQWAWNLISPKWSGIWPNESRPVAYNDGKTKKYVVLMTDGEFNTFDGRCDNSGCTPYGTRGRQSNDHAKALCANMKAQGITVYTIGFMLNHPAANETLETCATSLQHVFRPQNGGQLGDAFAAIGNQINNLRLTQ